MQELKKVKTEEAAKTNISRFEIPLIYSSLDINEPIIPIVDWLSILPISLFSFKLFADLGILNTVETFSDTQSDF